MEQLRDIKPLVEIPDYSFYLYLAVITFATIFTALLVYWLIKLFSKKRVDKKKEILKRLKNLNLDDSKKSAYILTKLGKELVKDDSSYKIYTELVKMLAKYKYKKKSQPFDKDTKMQIKLFLKVVDE